MKMQTANLKTPHPSAAGAFTLMELMVAIGILVMMILAIGMTFSGVSKSVGMSKPSTP